MDIKKTICIALVAMSFSGVAAARCLLLNEKNKTYTVPDALKEINASITSRASVSTPDYDIIASPFIDDYVASHTQMVMWAYPYEKPESYLKHKENGYIVRSRGKSFLTPRNS